MNNTVAQIASGFTIEGILGPAVKGYLARRDNLRGMFIFSLGALIVGTALAILFYIGETFYLMPISLIAFGLGAALLGLNIRAQVLGRTTLQALVLYRDGFAYQCNGRIDTCSWLEVASIISREEVDVTENHRYTAYLYTLIKTNGERIDLEANQFAEIVEIIGRIKQNAYATLMPPLRDRYKSGQSVSFGPVTISQRSGIQIHGKPFAWSNVFDIKVEKGRLVITTHDNHFVNVRACMIPNIELLCQLVGVDLGSIDLAYS
ncbi:MAG: hypothetical protein HZB51_09075 [Chloroflexi bacterium]|nr:hypothetical protein [Chloroflexota bacterium]